MTDPIKKWASDKRVWLGVAAIGLGAAYANDLIPVDGPVAAVAGAVATVLGVLGYQVDRRRKRRARDTVKIDPHKPM